MDKKFYAETPNAEGVFFSTPIGVSLMNLRPSRLT
jgi:hypothetical protein